MLMRPVSSPLITWPKPRPSTPADQVRGRHLALLEEQLDRVDALVAELGQRLRHAEARVALLDDEAGHAAVARLRARVGDRQQRERVALAPVGDEHLAAVEHVVVARRGGRWCGSPARRSRRAARSGRGRRAPRRRRSGAGSGARCSSVPWWSTISVGHRVAVDHAGQRHPAAAQLLDDPRVGASRRGRGPPYAAGTSAPKRPSSRMRATSACGYASACSSAAATGRTSSSTKRRTAATIGGAMARR